MSVANHLRLCCLGVAAAGSFASAAPPAANGWSPAFERLGIDRGLSQSVVTAIHQDRLGFMWFGTQEGLNRFDGRRFKVYRHDPTDPATLSSSSIEAIAGDPEGRLWLGTDDGGLNILDPRSEDVVTIRHVSGDAQTLSHDRVFDIAFDGSGHAWLGTQAGLDRVEIGNRQVRRLGESEPVASTGLAGAAVTTVLALQDGTVWAGTRESGLYRLGADGVLRYGRDEPEARRLAGDRITDLTLGADGVVWVTSRDGGLDRIGPGEPPTVMPGSRDWSLPDDELTTAHLLYDGTVILGSDQGYLYRADPERGLVDWHRHSPDEPDSVADGAVLALHEDRTGVLWVGSYGGGASKSKSLSSKVSHGILALHEGGELPDSFVRAIWRDVATGKTWIGTNSGLAFARPGASAYQVYRHAGDDPTSLSDDTVYAVMRRENGELWVGTRGGLNRLDSTTGGFQRYTEADGRGLPDGRIRDLAEDDQGRLWVASEGGLARYIDETDRFRKYLAGEGGLSSNETTALFVDTEGAIWVGTNNAGLNRLDPASGRFTYFAAGPGGLSHQSIWDVERVGDEVWVGTFSGGLNRIDLSTGEVSHFLEKDGLANNVVYQIVPDDQGRLWLSTNSGLSLFDPDSEEFLNFNPRDGLLNYEYNSNASFRDEQGRIWFGGISGLDIIDAPSVQPAATPAAAVLTELQLYNEPVGASGDPRLERDASVEYADWINLDYRASVFSVGLAALHFANPDTNRLRYRLDGLHDEWLETREAPHFVTFNSLPAGSYRLRVQASARGTDWGPERRLDIRIAPPPWLSPAAHVAYGLAALLMLLLVVRAHFRRVGAERRLVAQLNDMVASRTAELEALNERLKETNRRLEEATRRDPLTGLANRRELIDWLEREEASALRAFIDWADGDRGAPEPEHARLCFLAVDIDDFKQINDSWGHLAGDRILYEFASRMAGHCRSSDLAVRWGGEEFLLVLRAVGPRRACHLAERIRRVVVAEPVRLEDGRAVEMTCSIGFACLPFSTSHPDVGNWEAVVGLADAALYAAKKAGKNAWIGIGCPEDASRDEVRSLLRDPAVREARSRRAMIWRSSEFRP